MMKLAIYAITVNGAKQGARIKAALPFADLYISDTLEHQYDAQILTLPLSQFVAEKFSQYDGHVFVCATGIVMRMLSPLIKDKREDPAIVCLDEQANFVISLLSGHRGGANELAHRVAHILKATPVITTASDVSESVSADMLGAPFGWHLDAFSEPSITAVSAAIVNDEPVIIAQETGEKTWWKYDKRMPANILCSTTLDSVDSTQYRGAILISDRLLPAENKEQQSGELNVSQWQNKLVLWRPKSLVLGIGCDRNTPLYTLNAGLKAFSEHTHLSLDSVHSIASIDLKSNEVALLELSAQKQWPFITFPAEQLDDIEGIENPSDYVKKVTGSNSVAEAAALKQSKTKQLLVSKWTFKKEGFNMTIACCRRQFSESLVQEKRKNWLGQKKHGSAERHGASGHPSSIATFGATEPSSNPVTNANQAVNPQTIDVKINAFGNEVVEGYQCKPKHLDLERGMLFHRHHILLCEGTRCAKAGSKHLAHELRTLLKNMGLSHGEKRIKISRTQCAGACRNRSTLVIYERAANENHKPHLGSSLVNNGVWLRHVEDFSSDKWCELFSALANNQPVSDVIEPQYFVTIENPIKERHYG